MKEKIEVYESLRNEIIAIEEMQRNVWIYMYVLFCTLFVLGLQWSHNLFLVTYIVLIPFQCVINEYRWSLCKISTYIRIFFENEDKKISWESFHTCDRYKILYKERQKSINGVIGMSGAVHLGLLSTIFYCGYTLEGVYVDSKFLLSAENISMIILSIILFMCLVVLNRAYYKDYDRELENIIGEYKKERKDDNVQ